MPSLPEDGLYKWQEADGELIGLIFVVFGQVYGVEIDVISAHLSNG